MPLVLYISQFVCLDQQSAIFFYIAPLTKLHTHAVNRVDPQLSKLKTSTSINIKPSHPVINLVISMASNTKDLTQHYWSLLVTFSLFKIFTTSGFRSTS